MMSSTEDNLSSDLIGGKALETLIITSVRTLKRGNKKFATKFVRIFLTTFVNYVIVPSNLPKMIAHFINI